MDKKKRKLHIKRGGRGGRSMDEGHPYDPPLLLLHHHLILLSGEAPSGLVHKSEEMDPLTGKCHARRFDLR